MSRIRIGCDPELFVYKKDAPKVPIPIYGLIGGTKQEPLPIKSAELGYKGFFLQEDGAALEFNTPSAPGMADFIVPMQDFWRWLENMLDKKGLGIWQGSVAEFDRAALMSSPKGYALGCDPDFSVYKGKREKFDASAFGNKRYGAGHVHLGFDTNAIPVEVVVKLMDLMFTLPTLKWDKQAGGRRRFYGEAGLYRPKPYGVEYRTPSNWWCFHLMDNDFMSSLFRIPFDILTGISRNADVVKTMYKGIPWDMVQDSIATENVEMADEIIRFANKSAPGFMNSAWSLSCRTPLKCLPTKELREQAFKKTASRLRR